MVLLKRDGVIASAGDVAESADLRTARFPGDLTMPDIGTDLFAVREARSKFITDLYLGSWNLNWFYRLALNPDPAGARGRRAGSLDWWACSPRPPSCSCCSPPPAQPRAFRSRRGAHRSRSRC
jgi:hypothetical protein